MPRQNDLGGDAVEGTCHSLRRRQAVALKIRKSRPLRKGRGPARRVSTGELPDDAALAALVMVAHELNNIAVPLGGFAEYALQHGPDHRSVRECILEFQIGIARIRALALDLEGLGETDSQCEFVALDACVGRAMAELPGGVRPIEWCCPRDIKVRVDPGHARRAIASLIRVALATHPTKHPGALTISEKGSKPADCVVCDASLKEDGRWVFLQASGIRRLTPGVLRDPIRSDVAGRACRRLALAVLDHCAHRAGGHLHLDQQADLLTLALPIAH